MSESGDLFADRTPALLPPSLLRCPHAQDLTNVDAATTIAVTFDYLNHEGFPNGIHFPYAATMLIPRKARMALPSAAGLCCWLCRWNVLGMCWVHVLPTDTPPPPPSSLPRKGGKRGGNVKQGKKFKMMVPLISVFKTGTVHIT